MEILDKNHDHNIDLIEFSVFVNINREKFESTGLLKAEIQ
jgi:hypothetical protein